MFERTSLLQPFNIPSTLLFSSLKIASLLHRFEAIPSLVVFMIELFTFSNKAEFSVLNALLSAIMIGTKMSGKSADLTTQKGNLEGKLSELRGVKGRRGSIMSLMASVFGEGAAKVREDEARIDEEADEETGVELRPAKKTLEEEKREIELLGQMNDVEEGVGARVGESEGGEQTVEEVDVRYCVHRLSRTVIAHHPTPHSAHVHRPCVQS